MCRVMGASPRSPEGRVSCGSIFQRHTHSVCPHSFVAHSKTVSIDWLPLCCAGSLGAGSQCVDIVEHAGDVGLIRYQCTHLTQERLFVRVEGARTSVITDETVPFHEKCVKALKKTVLLCFQQCPRCIEPIRNSACITGVMVVGLFEGDDVIVNGHEFFKQIFGWRGRLCFAGSGLNLKKILNPSCWIFECLVSSVQYRRVVQADRLFHWWLVFEEIRVKRSTQCVVLRFKVFAIKV